MSHADDFGDGMEEGGWASLPHGTIIRVLKHAGRFFREGKHEEKGVWYVYWVDQTDPLRPQQKLRAYGLSHCPDELSAYMRFAKEMENG